MTSLYNSSIIHPESKIFRPQKHQHKNSAAELGAAFPMTAAPTPMKGSMAHITSATSQPADESRRGWIPPLSHGELLSPWGFKHL